MIAPFSFLNHTSNDSYTSKFITVGVDSAAWSDDLGLTWNASSINAGGWTKIQGDRNGTYVAARTVIGSPSYIEVAVSRDGGLNFDEYHTVVSGVVESAQSIIHDGEKWIITTSTTSFGAATDYYTSTDAQVWTPRALPRVETGAWSMAFGQGKYSLVFGGGSGANFFTSDDLNTWSSQTLNPSYQYQNVRFLPDYASSGQFVAHGASGSQRLAFANVSNMTWNNGVSGSADVSASAGHPLHFFTVPGQNQNWRFNGAASITRPQNSNWVDIASNVVDTNDIAAIVFVACSTNGTRRLARQTFGNSFNLVGTVTNTMSLYGVCYG